MKKILFLTLLTVSFSLFSNTLPTLSEALDFLNIEDLNTLEKNGELTLFHDDTFKPEYVPNCSLKETIVNRYETKDVNLGIEVLFLYDGIDPTDLSDNKEQYLNMFYNIFNSISTLQGIDYWSNSRQKYRTLFTESWLIDNLEEQNKISDPFDEIIPEKKVLYAHQKDKTFGNNESEITYLYKDDSINMNILNKTDMWYAIVKVLDKEKLSIDLLLVPTSSGLLYYGVITSKTIKIGPIMEKASNSFYYRIVAFNDWLVKRIEETK